MLPYFGFLNKYPDSLVLDIVLGFSKSRLVLAIAVLIHHLNGFLHSFLFHGPHGFFYEITYVSMRQ